MAITFDSESKSYSDGITTLAQSNIASVNGVSYTTLDAALAMAGAGDTITLLDNVTLSSKLNLTQSQEFDLNGFTLDGAVSLSGDADVKFQNGTMTAAYSSTSSNEYSVVTVNETSVLTLDGVTLTPADSLNRGQATHAVVYQSQFQKDWLFPVNNSFSHVSSPS